MFVGNVFWPTYGALDFERVYFIISLSDRYIKVVTSVDSYELYSISAVAPQGAIWSLLLFNLYIQLFPTVVKHCSIIGYADDHTLLKIIPQKSDHYNAATQLNQFGHPWNIEFTPYKTFSLIISLKTNISEHPPLFLNDYHISEAKSTNILGFTFDSTFTWQDHIVKALTCGKQ